MTQTIETAALAAPRMPVMCDQVGCTEVATHGYVWAWGESGVCCPKHMQALQQTSGYVERTIQFSVLNPDAAPPLERPERVRLKAEVYALQEELEEIKGRGLDLYRQNNLLVAQVQALTVRNREAELQLKDGYAANGRLQLTLDKLAAENGEMSDELSRLRILAHVVDVDDTTMPGTGSGPR